MLKSMLLTLVLLVGIAPAIASPITVHPDDAVVISESELQLALRDLWTGHIFWVRSVVLASHYDDDAAAEAAEAKAVENARALADAITPFYGQDAADKLFGLLAGHYGAIKEYMQAGFSENKSGKDAASKKLVANAEEIAIFLDGANPHLPKDAVLPLLMAHGGHHIQQIDAVHQGDFSKEAEVWDAMLGHIYAISDAMAGAFAKQFPEKVIG